MNESILFTPASLLDLLSSIDELSGIDVGITETIDGNLQLQIGSSYYELRSEDATDVVVDEAVVDQVDDINQTAYENLDENYDADQQPVESGIIREALKTLLLGGMIRLSAGILKN